MLFRSIETIKAGNYNLDLKNPHTKDEGPADLEALIPEYKKLLADIAATRQQLKVALEAALKETSGKKK